MKSLKQLLCVSLLSFNSTAFAQDDLDDILGETSEPSAEEERTDIDEDTSALLSKMKRPNRSSKLCSAKPS